MTNAPVETTTKQKAQSGRWAVGGGRMRSESESERGPAKAKLKIVQWPVGKYTRRAGG